MDILNDWNIGILAFIIVMVSIWRSLSRIFVVITTLVIVALVFLKPESMMEICFLSALCIILAMGAARKSVTVVPPAKTNHTIKVLSCLSGILCPILCYLRLHDQLIFSDSLFINVIKYGFLACALFMMTYLVSTIFFSNMIAPLIALKRENKSEKLEKCYISRQAGLNSISYCLKFAGDTNSYYVDFWDYRKLKNNMGDTFNFTVATGFFGCQFIRKPLKTAG